MEPRDLGTRRAHHVAKKGREPWLGWPRQVLAPCKTWLGVSGLFLGPKMLPRRPKMPPRRPKTPPRRPKTAPRWPKTAQEASKIRFRPIFGCFWMFFAAFGWPTCGGYVGGRPGPGPVSNGPNHPMKVHAQSRNTASRGPTCSIY